MTAPTYAEIIANRDTYPTVDGKRVKVQARERWAALYGATGAVAGTVDFLPPRYAGGPVRPWFTHDVDPGCGPMAYEAGAGIVLVSKL